MREKQLEILESLERFSFYTDSNFRIPFTGIRFGISPLIGFFPVAGDFVGLLLSVYVVLQAKRAGANNKLLFTMIRNAVIEFVVGLVPIAGDAFDMLYKANTRNTNLLRNFLYQELEIEPPKKLRIGMLILLSLGLLLLFWIIITILF